MAPEAIAVEQTEGPAKVEKATGPKERECGTTSLPLSRVKRIIKSDEAVVSLSQEATFLVCAATEYFIKNLAEQAHFQARAAGRKTIAYADLAKSCRASPALSFLAPIIPTQVPLSEALEKRQAWQKAQADREAGIAPVEAEADAEPVSKTKRQLDRERYKANATDRVVAELIKEQGLEDSPPSDPDSNKERNGNLSRISRMNEDHDMEDIGSAD